MSAGCKCRFPSGGANSTTPKSPNPLAGLERPPEAGRKERGEGREWKRKERKGGKRREKKAK